ncbi:hypothetical protein [Sphingomonas humi]|uniref:DUF2177 family protein n=1 Tax=Sphingomonas humi TaxID=335630 RepID=A0ABP7RRP0_9SPHN
MADMAMHSGRPASGAYWIGAVAVLAFELVGCGGYLATVLANPVAAPPDQQMLMAAMPKWQIPVYAIAVWSGLAGAVLLLMRRRWAVPVLLVSLLCAIGTFLPFVTVPAVKALATPANGYAAATVIVLCLLTFLFARSAAAKGILR